MKTLGAMIAACSLLLGCANDDPILFPSGSGSSSGAGGVGGGSECAAKGRTDCDGTCADLLYDQRHCGACDNQCALGTKCNAGDCDDCASLALTNCNGVCVDVNNDAKNCGACGNVCAGGKCSSGGC